MSTNAKADEGTATAQADYESRFGDDPEMEMRREHRLLINGVPFSLLYDYCVRNLLPLENDFYTTVVNDLKAKGKL